MRRSEYEARAKNRQEWAAKLHKRGVAVKEIAAVVKISVRSAYAYIRAGCAKYACIRVVGLGDAGFRDIHARGLNKTTEIGAQNLIFGLRPYHARAA